MNTTIPQDLGPAKELGICTTKFPSLRGPCGVDIPTRIIKGSLVANFRYTNFWAARVRVVLVVVVVVVVVVAVAVVVVVVVVGVVVLVVVVVVEE